MKKLLLLPIVSLLLVACSNNEKKEDDTSKKTDDMTTVYEKNLGVVKSAIAAFEKKDIDSWAASVADSAVWNSPVMVILLPPRRIGKKPWQPMQVTGRI